MGSIADMRPIKGRIVAKICPPDSEVIQIIGNSGYPQNIARVISRAADVTPEIDVGDRVVFKECFGDIAPETEIILQENQVEMVLKEEN